MRGPDVLLYGDVDLNIIDGSSVWLASIAEVLALSGASVRLALKTPIVNDRLVQRLARLSSIELLDPPASLAGEPLSPRLAARVLASAHQARPADVILVRGLRISAAVAANASMKRRLWAYVTDIPHTALNLAAPANELLAKVTQEAYRLFAQTEDARSYLESLYPASAGKTALMPPMVPAVPSRSSGHRARRTDQLRMVYSGKLAKDWQTLEMLSLPRLLRERHGVVATLDVVGDKIQDDKQDTSWAPRMRAMMDENASHESGVSFRGGLPRDESLQIIAESDVGLSWRSAALDGSLEVSTKALEYASSGVMPLVNDTAAHRRLFGPEFRGYITGIDSLIDTLALLGRRPDLLEDQSRGARQAVAPYGFPAAVARFRRLFALHAPSHEERVRPRVVVAGHDFKFAADVFAFLEQGGYEYRVDKWDSLRQHDEVLSRELAEWADVVFCEWAGPNVVWYSVNLPRSTRLVTRFHGFEIRAPWVGDIDVERVDEIAFVSEFFRSEAVAELGWRDASSSTVPNSVDTLDLDRAKVSGAEFHLGILGIVPFLKRPDRALDLLEKLVAEDERYVLHIRGRAPWNYSWEWSKEWQRDAYSDLLRRVGSAGLRSHVILEDFGPDVGNWLRQIGWILSPSTRETFHLAAAEGMASGAVPIIWDRPGARAIFGDSWVVAGTEAAAARVLAASAPTMWGRLSQEARRGAAQFDVAARRADWERLLVPNHAPSPPDLQETAAVGLRRRMMEKILGPLIKEDEQAPFLDDAAVEMADGRRRG